MPNDHTSLACVNTPSSKLCNKQSQSINSQMRPNMNWFQPLVQANARALTHPHACDNLQDKQTNDEYQQRYTLSFVTHNPNSAHRDSCQSRRSWPSNQRSPSSCCKRITCRIRVLTNSRKCIDSNIPTRQIAMNEMVGGQEYHSTCHIHTHASKMCAVQQCLIVLRWSAV